MKYDNIAKLAVLISGCLVIALYCVFTILSWSFYPDAYGPMTHYLSRLGNVTINTTGAIFYNLGCILTGIALIPFFMGLIVWRTARKLQTVPLILGQILGVISGIALIMIGIFSEDQGAPHMDASSTFFLLNFFVLILLSFGFLLNSNFMKPVAIYGILLDFLTLGFELSIGGPITEWLTVFGSLLFVGLVVVSTYVRKKIPKTSNESV